MDWVHLQRNLPHCQFRERHRRLIGAPASVVWQALHSARVTGSAMTRAAVSLRMLPERLAGRTLPQPTLFDLDAMGSFLRLGEDVERELVLGMVGAFWRPRGSLVEIRAADFATYADPAHAKLAWGFRLEPKGEATMLHTETRVFCPTTVTERRFRPYWYLIRPISGLIRREILAGIDHEAMARLRT